MKHPPLLAVQLDELDPSKVTSVVVEGSKITVVYDTALTPGTGVEWVHETAWVSPPQGEGR